ncbi:MAG: hypothetical protein EBV40_03110, partial [Actinobacteria bacterium]|nr:hypothetical protein [Actinomycetota bacterium]
QYWKPGMKPPTVEELMAQVAAPATTAAPSADGSAPELSAAEKLIPAHLLERSRNARKKAEAK